jgi:hypothetical protein
VSWLSEPDDWDADDDKEPRSHLKLIAAILAGWLVVSLIVLGGLVLFRHPKSNTAQSHSTPPASTGSPTPTVANPPLPDGWVQQAADDQTNCAGHSYGQVKTFFGTTPCTSMHRVLATTNQGGRAVVVASSVVTFSTATQAQQYLTLVTSDGTGNVNDLLREGGSVAGLPKKLPEAAFESRQDGNRVLVAEAAYTDGKSNATDPGLKALAQRAIGPS